MSRCMRTAILTFLIATPTFFLTVLAGLRVGLFGLVVRAWVIWRGRRQVARENAALSPVVCDLVEFYEARTPDSYHDIRRERDVSVTTFGLPGSAQAGQADMLPLRSGGRAEGWR